MRTARTIIPLAILLTLGAGVACKKPAAEPAPEAPKPAVLTPVAPGTATVMNEDEARRKAEEAARLKAAEEARLASYRQAAETALQDIHFDYDRSDIREMDKPKLQAIADFLKTFQGAKIQIEGHCDERGTVEYNLALGERRAHTAQTYLAGLGSAEARLSFISYGKERPKVQGKDEESWLVNRRCEFKLQ